MIRLFGHYVSKFFLLLGMLEFLVCFYSLIAGFYIRFAFSNDELAGNGASIWLTATLFALLMSAAMTAVGLYQRGLPLTAGLLVRIGLSFLFASMTISMLFYIFPDLFLGRGVMAYAMLFSLVGILGLRSVFFRVVGNEAQEHRVLVIGTGSQADMIRALEDQPLRFSVVGYVQISDAEVQIPEDRRINLDRPLLEFIVDHEVDELVIAPDDRRRRLPVNQILDCKMSGIHVLDLLSFFEKEIALIPIDILHPSWIFFSSGFRLGGLAQYGKRMLDLTGATLILVIASPIMLLVALAIWIESGFRGTVFYHQIRVGLNGRHFYMHKFRSMEEDAEADGKPLWAKKNDSRITRVGSFIRKARLDELPQVFNVLRGDMSLVGPRPERPEFADELSREIPFYDERHRVKPGVTGWAQLCFEYGSTIDDAKQKLEYDLYYVKNASLFLDLIILLETVEVVLWGRGAR